MVSRQLPTEDVLKEESEVTLRHLKVDFINNIFELVFLQSIHHDLMAVVACFALLLSHRLVGHTG